MSFSAIIRADKLGAILDSVDTLVGECKVHLTEDGIEIRAVDPANVGMVDIEASERAFESYDATGGTIGVGLERLQDVVGMADSDDMVELDLDKETRKLSVRVGGLDMTMALIDPESIRQEPEIPDLDLPATVAVEGGKIDRMVKAADLVSDHIAIGADEQAEEFYAEAEGDTDDVELRLGNDDVLTAVVEESAHSLFSLGYLADIKSAIPSDAEVSLRLGSEMPVKLRYSLADGDVTVQNMVAPRIQSE